MKTLTYNFLFLSFLFGMINSLQAQTFEEKNGKLTFEAEAINLSSSWKKMNSKKGYSGSGYITWTGKDFFKDPGNGQLKPKIKINTPGTYLVSWITAAGKGSENTEHNDTWLKFPTATDFFAQKGGKGKKLYPKGSPNSNSGNHPEGASGKGYFKIYVNSLNWNKRTATSDKDPHEVYVTFNKKGTYEMNLSARSNYHLIDKISLIREGNAPAPDEKLKPGRVAVVADGNWRDSDDIAATPVTLAIIKAFKKDKQLVHYSHSCDLVKGPNDPGNAQLRQKEMQISCDKTKEIWGGFPNVKKFYNCQTEKNAAVNDLKNAINASSKNNPLWIIEAGEPDVIWEAVDKSENNKRKFVYIITHHPNNDKGDFHDLSDVLKLGVPNKNAIRIPDQNNLLKVKLDKWNWAKNHKDNRIKHLYDRGFRAQQEAMDYRGIRGFMDPSDAGMMYYWATLDSQNGPDEKADTPKLRKLFENYIKGTGNPPANKAPSVKFSKPNKDLVVKEGYKLVVEVNATDQDGTIDNVALFIDDKLIRREKVVPYEWGHASSPNSDELNNLPVGVHTIKAVATDNDGKTGQASIRLTVQKKGDVDPNPPSGDCNFGTPLSSGISGLKQSYKNTYVLGSDGPSLNNIRKFSINYNPSFDGLYTFAVNTKNGNPSYYVDLKSKIQFQLKNAKPELTLKNSGIAGLDGSYWIRVTQSSFIMVSKSGNYSIHFSNSTTKPSCSNKSSDNINAAQLLAYPNPTSDHIVVTGITADAYSASLMNYTGKQILKISTDTNEEGILSFSIGDLPSGVYFLRVQNLNNAPQILKLLKR